MQLNQLLVIIDRSTRKLLFPQLKDEFNNLEEVSISAMEKNHTKDAVSEGDGPGTTTAGFVLAVGFGDMTELLLSSKQ